MSEMQLWFAPKIRKKGEAEFIEVNNSLVLHTDHLAKVSDLEIEVERLNGIVNSCNSLAMDLDNAKEEIATLRAQLERLEAKCWCGHVWMAHSAGRNKCFECPCAKFEHADASRKATEEERKDGPRLP